MKYIIYLQITSNEVTRSSNGYLGAERLSAKSTSNEKLLSLDSIEEEAIDATKFPSKGGATARLERLVSEYDNIEYAELMVYDEDEDEALAIEDAPHSFSKK